MTTDPRNLPILIVEDDLGLRKLMQAQLKRLELETIALGSAAEAIQWLSEHSARLMLLDYSLPDMTGEGTIAALQQAGRTPPFIVVTGHGSETVAVQMMKLGARDYLVKNAGMMELMPTVVNQVLEQLDREYRLSEAEEQLRRSEELHRSVLESMPAAVLKVSPDGRLVYANSEARRILRLTSGKLSGLTASDLQRRTVLEDWSPCRQRHHPLTRCLQTREPQQPQRLGLRHDDGSVSWAIYSATPLVEPRQSTLIAVMLSFVDVSQQIDADQALRATSETLEKEARQGAARVKTLQERLDRERSRRRHAETVLGAEQQLAGLAIANRTVSCESINEVVADPLRVVLGLLRNAQRDGASGSESVQEAVRQLEDCLGNTIALTSGSSCLPPPSPLEAAIRQLVEGGIDHRLLPDGVPPPAVELDYQIFETPLPAAVEATAFATVRALLDNVYAHSYATHARVQLAVLGDTLTIEVQDWGRGTLPTQKTGESSLTLLGDQIEANGGRLRLRAIPDEGVQAFVELPIHPTEADDTADLSGLTTLDGFASELVD